MSKARKKKELLIDDGTAAARQLPPLTYDPLEPQYSALHRAGMVGLALQIEAMKIRNKALPNDQAFPIPELCWLEDGRSMKVTLSYETFETLLQERYLGIALLNRKRRRESNNGSEDEQETVKEVLVPRLRYLEDLGADPEFQSHIRYAYRASFFSIYQERESFFKAAKAKKTLTARIGQLWDAIVHDGPSEIQKSSRPNIVGNDLKGNSLQEPGKNALLLHFWSLSSWFFTPKTLKYDKRKKELNDDALPPVIVVPDVTDVRSFVEYVKNSYSRPFQKHIHTSLEAALAFYVAPLVAHGQTITEEIKSELHQLVSGATVFVYRRSGKQPEVAGVFSDAYDDDTLQRYVELQNQEFRSTPYHTMRVENLLAKSAWYFGFSKLVDYWPLELFVPVKNRKTNAYELKPKGLDLAKDLAADFRYFAMKEDEMDETETNIPSLIDELVETYLRERVYAKGQTQFDKTKMKQIFEKEKKSRSADEKEIHKAFGDKHEKGVNQEFIDFRGATDQPRFTELFVTRLFDPNLNAPYTTPEERAMLRSFYENHWESARWLVLMAISAAGAPREPKHRSP